MQLQRSKVDRAVTPYFKRAQQDKLGAAASQSGVGFQVLQVAQQNPKAEELLGLVRAGDLAPAIDELYDVFRSSLRARRLDYLESLVRGLRESVPLSPQFAIAVLTATLPVRNSLNGRSKFYEAVSDHLRAIGRVPSEVLHGLE